MGLCYIDVKKYDEIMPLHTLSIEVTYNSVSVDKASQDPLFLEIWFIRNLKQKCLKWYQMISD